MENLKELNESIRALPLTDDPLECRNLHKYNMYTHPELTQGHQFWSTVGFDGTNSDGENNANRVDCFSICEEGHGIFAWMEDGKSGRKEVGVTTIDVVDIRRLEPISREEYDKRIESIAAVIDSLDDIIRP